MSKKCYNCENEKPENEFRTIRRKNKTETISYLCSWCKDCERVRALERHNKNKEHNLERAKKWKEENHEHVKEHRREYLQRTGYNKNNPIRRVRMTLCCRLYKHIRKDNPTEEYLGTPVSFIKTWLEYNFTKEMNWENFGKYWQIDHTIPISLFDCEDETQVSIAFNWKNLMPMRSEENNKKHNYLYENLVKLQEQQVRKFHQENGSSDDIDKYFIEYNTYFKKFTCNTTKLRETP